MYIIRDIPFNKISIIKELWEKNRKYHENISVHFGNLYSDLVFEERMRSFGSFDEEHIKISVAENENSRTILGYCISTYEGAYGETQSLHVEEGTRNSGIGKILIDKHINWMKDNDCKIIGLTVAADNQDTIKFYKKLGFRENTIEMRLV